MALGGTGPKEADKELAPVLEEPLSKRIKCGEESIGGIEQFERAKKEVVNLVEKLPRQAPLPLPGHSSVDFSAWALVSSTKAKNQYGNVNWNVRGPVYDANRFNFHELPSEGKSGDPWSTIIFDVKAETFEGAPADKVKIFFEIADPQEVSVSRYDESMIDKIEKQSADVLNQKSSVKREVIASQHYKSAMTQRTETRGPRVKMTFVVRGSDRTRLGVMYFFKLSEDGETYEKKPIMARGWAEIEPLIAGHHLRGAKMRATVVQCWCINVMKKDIYPMMEIKEMWVREPKRRGTGQYAGMSEEQQELMNSME
jgi:hypothetical protein